MLIAVGRKPRTENIGLEKTQHQAGARLHQGDEWMQTGEPGVYAIGDIVLGMPQLAHVGAMEGIVAVAKIAGKRPGKPVNPEHIPGAPTAEPQIGSVGLDRSQAKEAGYELKIGKFPFTRQLEGHRSSASTKASSRSWRTRSTAKFWACTSSARRPPS